MSLEAIGLTPDCLWEVLGDSEGGRTNSRLHVQGHGCLIGLLD